MRLLEVYCSEGSKDARMNNRIRIGYLALTDREVEVVRSIFSLVPQFAGKCDVVVPSEAHRCHIVIVNTDHPLALRWWNAIRKHNKLVVPLMLSRRRQQLSGAHLRRPLQVKPFIEALDGLIIADDVMIQGDVGTSDVLNILVVDDSYPVRKHMEHTLPRLDNGLIDIRFASSGEEALQQVSGASYDLVFLDVVMSGINGYKVCKAIKARGTAYVVMLTSKKSPFDRVRGTMSGCDAYITKPPPLGRLREEMAKCRHRREKAQRTGVREEGIVVSGVTVPATTSIRP